MFPFFPISCADLPNGFPLCTRFWVAFLLTGRMWLTPRMLFPAGSFLGKCSGHSTWAGAVVPLPPASIVGVSPSAVASGAHLGHTWDTPGTHLGPTGSTGSGWVDQLTSLSAPAVRLPGPALNCMFCFCRHLLSLALWRSPIAGTASYPHFTGQACRGASCRWEAVVVAVLRVTGEKTQSVYWPGSSFHLTQKAKLVTGLREPPCAFSCLSSRYDLLQPPC